MYRTYSNTFLLTFLVLVTGFTVCSGSNGTSPQTGDGSVEKTSLEKGMEPIYKMLHGFLDTVMPHNFYSQDDAPFSVQDLDKIIKNSDYGKLQEDWQDLFKTFGGFAACFIFGLLFVVFFPFVTGCFCCCFCCCKNCGGGKNKYDPKRASCMRMMCATFLLVFTTMMLYTLDEIADMTSDLLQHFSSLFIGNFFHMFGRLEIPGIHTAVFIILVGVRECEFRAGGIITFLGAELFHKALKNENNEGMLGTIDNNLAALQTFRTDAVAELRTKTKQEVESGLNKIEAEVKDTVEKTVTKVENTINATSILDQTEHLGNASMKVNEDLKNINDSLQELRRLQENVTLELSNIKNTINTHCTGACASQVDTSELNFNPNFTALDQLQTEADKISKTQNITKLITDAKSKFDDVKADVDRDVNSNINQSTTKINEIKDELNSQLATIDNASRPFNDSLQDGRNYIKNNQEDIAKISDYIWYGCIGVASTVMLVVFFYYMGVLFGLCGERPGSRAACCNRGTGANLLYTGVWVSAIFSWLVMLVVALLFLTGGLTYTLFCRYVSDGIENVGTFETVVQDSLGWNVSHALGVKNLTISGMFQNCKENKALYTALRFESLFNIDNIVNVSDIEKEVDSMTDHAFVLNNITLMTPDLEKQLIDFLNAGLQNISFQEYTRELTKPVTGSAGSSLNSIADDIDRAANATGVPPADKAGLNQAATDLRTLQSNQIQDIETQKGILNASLFDLQKHVDLTEQVNALIDGINKAQDTFNRDKDRIVNQKLGEATDVIKKLITTTVDNALSMVKNDIGRCRPLYDAAQNMIDAGCVMGLDSLNSIWFGLGWAAFFYIPCFICAAVLAALYMKIGPYDQRRKHDHFDEPIHDAYNGYGGSNQDSIPLTSQHMQDHINGKFNGAYDRNEGIELRRNQQNPRSSGYGYDPYQGQSSSYHDGGGYGSPERPPPDYDELTRNDIGGRGGGGYPKSQYY